MPSFPRLLESFRPDVVVTQLGVDTFWNDPLADLELTTNGFCEVVSFMVQHAPSWVALGGGGYSITNVARAWSLAWAIMNDIHLPDDLPESMVGPLSAEEGVAPRLRDSGTQQQAARSVQRAHEGNDRVP